MSSPVGVLVMAYGTPATPDDVEAYYTHIRRGRAPTPEQLADLQRRYDAIGGTSPLLERTRAQVAAIADALAPHGAFTVELGMKHAPPFIEDAVDALVNAGCSRAVGVVLAPHYSRLSVGEYEERARDAAGTKLEFLMVDSWHMAEPFIDALSARVRVAAAELPEPTEVVFTAHSLPARILDDGDPYPDQLRETAAAVADRAGIKRWRTGWQSAGRTPEPWLGPDIGEVLEELMSTGAGAVVVCPAGFTSDHLEVLYDLDVEAAALAKRLGIGFARTESLNDDPRLAAAVAGAVLERV